MKSGKRISYKKSKRVIYPYKWDLEIVLTNDVNGYASRLGWNDWNGTLTAGAFHRSTPSENRSVMVLPTEGSYGIIAHEAYHLMCSIYRTCGVKSRDEEATAYFLEDLVDDIIGLIDTMKKKKVSYFKATKGDRR